LIGTFTDILSEGNTILEFDLAVVFMTGEVVVLIVDLFKVEVELETVV